MAQLDLSPPTPIWTVEHQAPSLPFPLVLGHTLSPFLFLPSNLLLLLFLLSQGWGKC